MKLTGANITNITLTYCPTIDSTFSPMKSFSLSNLRPKHVLWSIFGVATVVCVGMLIGLMVNYIRAFYKKKFTTQPVNYIHLDEDSSFA